VYSNPKWIVYRLLTVPADAVNATAHLKRAWCFFETADALQNSRDSPRPPETHSKMFDGV